MIKEYMVVKSTKNLSKKVLIGTVGTVLMVYDHPSIAYEVEFVDENNQTIEVLTVYPRDIETFSK